MNTVIDNRLVHYIDVGMPNAQPVVFIHGFPLSLKMWCGEGGQVAALEKTHRVVAYDVRGHGASEVGSGHYTIEFFVDDLIHLLDHLKIKQAIIVGLSMGGYIALRAIERHPERFNGLVLCDTQSAADSNDAKINRAANIKLIETQGVKVFAEKFIKKIFAEESFKTHSEIIKSMQKIIELTSPAVLCGTLLALAARTDTMPSLQKINCPTLIMVGEKDGVTPRALSEIMLKKIPNAQMRVIFKAGHMSNLENPAAFNQNLRSFLEKLNDN